MMPLSQRDTRWKNLALGTSSETIGTAGCTITSLAMILGTTPDYVNDRIKQVEGYAQGNLVIWAKLEEAFPGIKVKRVWTYDNADVKANVPNVLVEVDGKPIGGFRHWLVYIGSQKAFDPWTGKEVSTSQYPNPLSYCVIGGKWNKPSPATDLQAELDKVRQDRDRNWNAFIVLCDALQAPRDVNVALAELKKLIYVEDKLVATDNKLQEANVKIQDLESKLEEVTETNEELMDENTRLYAEAEKTAEKVQQQADELKKQAFTIGTLREDIEDLKKMTGLPMFTGLRKFLFELLLKL